MTETMKTFIQTAIADGELEQKEIDFLRRKASETGDDPDEVEMTAKAEMAMFRKFSEKKSDKHGDAKKCPACGALIASMAWKCPECDYEFSSVGANASVKELFDRIYEIESQRKEVIGKGPTSNPLAAYGRQMSSVLTGGERMSNEDKRITFLIQNFPVPNSKADIIEFLMTAAPKCSNKGKAKAYWGKYFSGGSMDALSSEAKAEKAIKQAWRTKCSEVMTKAMILLSTDAEAIATLEYIKKEYKLK